MKWIRAKDQSPKVSDWYLITEDDAKVSVAYYSLECREPYWHNECYEPDVVYWMPFPKAPVDDSDLEIKD